MVVLFLETVVLLITKGMTFVANSILYISSLHGGDYKVSVSNNLKAEFHNFLRTRRTIRRYQQKEISMSTIIEILEDGRMAPSAGNGQKWEFIAVTERDLVEKMFEYVRWLRGLAPSCDEKPTAYIVLLGDQENCAFAAATMLLSAHAEGLGGCVIGSVDRENVKSLLKIPDDKRIAYVISLGYSQEEAVAKDTDEEIRVYKDDSGLVNVPKRRLHDIAYLNKYGKEL